jgi:hypothetical protein
MASDCWHVDLPFRGDRPYVHSASICNHLRQRFGTVSRLELVMREWMASRVLFAPLDEMPNAKATLRVDFPDGAPRRYGLTDDPAHPVSARVPYDELGLVANASIEGKVISVGVNPDGSFFDRLVAGNKALINRLLDPGVKLIATKVAVDGFLPDDAAFQIRLDSHLGTRIYRSSVLVDGDKVGDVIYYGQ